MSDEELDALDRLSEARGVSRNEALRVAVRRGAREELLRIAFEQYRNGEVGMRGAAEIVGLTFGEMMDEANEREVRSNYDESELDEDFEALG